MNSDVNESSPTLRIDGRCRRAKRLAALSAELLEGLQRPATPAETRLIRHAAALSLELEHLELAAANGSLPVQRHARACGALHRLYRALGLIGSRAEPRRPRVAA